MGLSREAEPERARLLFGQLQRSPFWALRVWLFWRWVLRFWAGINVQKLLLDDMPTRVFPGQLWVCEQTYSSSAPALASTSCALLNSDPRRWDGGIGKPRVRRGPWQSTPWT